MRCALCGSCAFGSVRFCGAPAPYGVGCGGVALVALNHCKTRSVRLLNATAALRPAAAAVDDGRRRAALAGWPAGLAARATAAGLGGGAVRTPLDIPSV